MMSVSSNAVGGSGVRPLPKRDRGCGLCRRSCCLDLFLLVNPAWRDKSSFGIFGAQKAQELILDRYETTYALDQFIVRGRQISLLKCWSSDWGLYAVVNNGGDGKDKSMPAELIASYATRPEYKVIDAALKGVVSK